MNNPAISKTWDTPKGQNIQRQICAHKLLIGFSKLETFIADHPFSSVFLVPFKRKGF